MQLLHLEVEALIDRFGLLGDPIRLANRFSKRVEPFNAHSCQRNHRIHGIGTEDGLQVIDFLLVREILGGCLEYAYNFLHGQELAIRKERVLRHVLHGVFNLG